MFYVGCNYSIIHIQSIIHFINVKYWKFCTHYAAQTMINAEIWEDILHPFVIHVCIIVMGGFCSINSCFALVIKLLSTYII